LIFSVCKPSQVCILACVANPIAGVIVAPYNTGNATIANNGVLVSGADGIVDFGDSRGNTATETVSYSSPSTGQNVELLINAPTQDNILKYIDDYGIVGDMLYSYLPPSTLVNSNLNNVSQTAIVEWIVPLNTFGIPRSGLTKLPV